MAKPFKTLTDKMSPEHRARASARAARMLGKLTDLLILAVVLAACAYIGYIVGSMHHHCY